MKDFLKRIGHDKLVAYELVYDGEPAGYPIHKEPDKIDDYVKELNNRPDNKVKITYRAFEENLNEGVSNWEQYDGGLALADRYIRLVTPIDIEGADLDLVALIFQNKKDAEFKFGYELSVETGADTTLISKGSSDYLTEIIDLCLGAIKEFDKKNNTEIIYNVKPLEPSKSDMAFLRESINESKPIEENYDEDDAPDEAIALAKFLGIPVSNIEQAKHSYYDLPTFEAKKENEIYTYSVSNDEYDIKRAVEDSLENLYDDIGFEEFSEKVLPYLGGTETFLTGDLESYYTNDYYEYAEDIAYSEPERFKEELEKLGLDPESYDHSEDYTEWETGVFDAFADAMYKQLDDPIEEFIAEWGHDSKMIEHYLTLDFSAIADKCISRFGAGHELAVYDNATEEEELDGITYYLFLQDVENIKNESLDEISDKTAFKANKQRAKNWRDSGYARGKELDKLNKSDKLMDKRTARKGVSTEQAIDNLVNIGFDKLSAYKPHVAKSAKGVLNRAVDKGLAVPHDFGRGKGKYRTNLHQDDVALGLIDDEETRNIANRYLKKQQRNENMNIKEAILKSNKVLKNESREDRTDHYGEVSLVGLGLDELTDTFNDLIATNRVNNELMDYLVDNSSYYHIEEEQIVDALKDFMIDMIMHEYNEAEIMDYLVDHGYAEDIMKSEGLLNETTTTMSITDFKNKYGSFDLDHSSSPFSQGDEITIRKNGKEIGIYFVDSKELTLYENKINEISDLSANLLNKLRYTDLQLKNAEDNAVYREFGDEASDKKTHPAFKKALDKYKKNSKLLAKRNRRKGVNEDTMYDSKYDKGVYLRGNEFTEYLVYDRSEGITRYFTDKQRALNYYNRKKKHFPNLHIAQINNTFDDNRGWVDSKPIDLK